MLPELLILALASPSPHREVYLPENYEELKRAREEREAARAERERERVETQVRWDSERAFHFVVRAGARIDALLNEGAVEVALGFSKRLAATYAIQGNVSVGSGFSARHDNSRGLLFDSSGDITLRVGSWRMYFGFGPLARVRRIVGDREPFLVGGGAVTELGFLFGEDRELDLMLRVQAGGFYRAREPDWWISETVALAWHF